MGSQPIRIQLGKILQENLAKKSCGVILQENLGGKSCGKILQENLAGQRGGEKGHFKKDSDWWKFSIWNRVMVSQDTAWENLVGKSCGKFLQEILVGQGGGKKVI